MRQIYKTDDKGIYLRPVLVEDDYVIKDNTLVDINIPFGLYMPKWDGTKWIEGKTPDEFEIDRITSELLPSIDDEEEAIFEIRLIDKLNEWGML